METGSGNDFPIQERKGCWEVETGSPPKPEARAQPGIFRAAPLPHLTQMI